jgi:hypothetical protein
MYDMCGLKAIKIYILILCVIVLNRLVIVTYASEE